MKYFIVTFFILFANIGFGQNPKVSEDIILTIKNDVWIPYMEAFQNLDTDKFESIYTKDIIRVEMEKNSIKLGKTYFQDFGLFLKDTQKEGGGIRVVFVIISTAIAPNQKVAYQTGYYQFSLKKADEKDFNIGGYGYFNVGLKKQKGKWKIFLDSDKEANISEQEFRQAGDLYKLK